MEYTDEELRQLTKNLQKITTELQIINETEADLNVSVPEGQEHDARDYTQAIMAAPTHVMPLIRELFMNVDRLPDPPEEGPVNMFELVEKAHAQYNGEIDE